MTPEEPLPVSGLFQFQDFSAPPRLSPTLPSPQPQSRKLSPLFGQKELLLSAVFTLVFWAPRSHLRASKPNDSFAFLPSSVNQSDIFPSVTIPWNVRPVVSEVHPGSRKICLLFLPQIQSLFATKLTRKSLEQKPEIRCLPSLLTHPSRLSPTSPPL